MEYREISGILTGVGVGPGDPQLMTLRAAETVQNAHCVAWMATSPGQSRARDVALAWIPESARKLEFVLPMVLDPEPAERVYDAAASQIGHELRAGRNVACLCEGDPMFYGSFMYLHARLNSAYPIRVVPGVPSIAAASATLRMPLAAREDRFAAVPASLDEVAICAAIRSFETIAFLKVGRHLPRLRRILQSCGVASKATFIENASLANERVSALTDAPDSASYFSMVVLRLGRAGSL